METISFTSSLENARRGELESLLFFNTEQNLVTQVIMASIAEHGMPEIAIVDERLRVRLKSGREVQALFALAGASGPLLGTAIYLREGPTILVLHIAVVSKYCSKGTHANALLVPRLVTSLRELARRIKGVEALRIVYSREKSGDIPLQRQSQPIT